MSKYEPLGRFLKGQGTEQVSMSFAQIERVTGATLPRSKRYPAWWSNNAWNNVMTKVWLEAGFRTEQVDIPGEKLVFRRVRSEMQEASRMFESAPKAPSVAHPIIGALKGTFTIEAGWDLTNHALDADELAALDASSDATADMIDAGVRSR